MTTINRIENARRIANSLTQSQLTPCVQILTGIESIYRWENKIETEIECLLLIKTNINCIKKVKDLIKDIHEYELPEFVMVNANIISKEYEKWFNNNLLNE